MIEDIGDLEGLDEGHKLIALIDADTIAYAAAIVTEYSEEVMPESFYTKEEYAAILAHPNYDAEEGVVWHQDIEMAAASAQSRIQDIMFETDTGSVELYFTVGKNFRYDVYDMYKGNRTDRKPTNLKEIKKKLLDVYPGAFCEEYEADDLVVMLKRQNPDKYVMCATDKDVLGAVGGKHFNYYQNARYDIPMKWHATTHASAKVFHYKQTLMGDMATDNIPGCPGIGKVKAAQIIEGLKEPKELWDAVVNAFLSKKLTEKEALRDMRLVNMHQLYKNSEGELKINLWQPPA